MTYATSIYTERYGETNPTIVNLIQLLQSRAIQQPERLAYTFLLDGEEEESHLTYGELGQQARAIAASLHGLVCVASESSCPTPLSDYLKAVAIDVLNPWQY